MQKKRPAKHFTQKIISIFHSCLCFAGLLMIPLCRAYPCKVDLLVTFHIRSRQIQSINKLLDTVVAFRGLRRLCVSCQHDVRLFLNVFSFLFDHYKNSSINSPGVIISGLSISISEKSLSPVIKMSISSMIAVYKTG